MTDSWWVFTSGIVVVAWFLGTGLAGEDQKKDFFTAQFQFVANLVLGPPRWIAGAIAAPGNMIKGYWSHKEKMRQITTNTETNKRLGVLESIAIDSKED